MQDTTDNAIAVLTEPTVPLRQCPENKHEIVQIATQFIKPRMAGFIARPKIQQTLIVVLLKLIGNCTQGLLSGNRHISLLPHQL